MDRSLVFCSALPAPYTFYDGRLLTTGTHRGLDFKGLFYSFPFIRWCSSLLLAWKFNDIHFVRDLTLAFSPFRSLGLGGGSDLGTVMHVVTDILLLCLV